MLGNLAHDVFAVAKPAKMGQTLTDPHDLSAVLTGKAESHRAD
jgi:hypothetical protein